MAALSEKGRRRLRPLVPPVRPGAAQVTYIQLLDSSKVPFYPIDPSGQRVTMYVCGPTVYDAAHLGHARTYFQFDVIRRILRDVLSHDVVYVMNVTDVDDKIIVRSQERGITPEALAREWERKFLEDMTALGVERPSAMPRVTEYVPEIVAFVETCVKNGFAYEDRGSVYLIQKHSRTRATTTASCVPRTLGIRGLMAEGEEIGLYYAYEARR